MTDLIGRRKSGAVRSGMIYEHAVRRGLGGAAALALSCVVWLLMAPVAVGNLSKIHIVLSGRIGSVKINSSTRAEIIRRVGSPDVWMGGNIGQGAPPTPNYQLLGYGCTQQPSYATCAVNYFLNARRHRLESFSTTSAAFVLPGDVHVGMPAARAVQIEGKPDIGGCGQGITVTTDKLRIYISTHGGHLGSDAHVAGGRVSEISIDDRRYGVGVDICL
jgi:hypothetical protein